MNHDEILQAAKDVGLLHPDAKAASRIVFDFAAIIEKRTIERCAVPEHAINSIKEACEEAMHYTVAARIPECGNFGRIAQNLSFALHEIAAIRKLGEQ